MTRYFGHFILPRIYVGLTQVWGSTLNALPTSDTLFTKSIIEHRLPTMTAVEDTLVCFRNPVIWEDLPDMEVIRVGKIFYMSCSSFHFSPGAPILKSENLTDWEYVGHSVPEIPGDRFMLNGSQSASYVKGVWASTMRYRRSNGLYYWYGPLQGTERTFIFTAEDPAGEWSALKPIEKFYYDLGLLIDDDDTMYLAYGTKTIHVSKLSPNGQQEVESKAVYTSEEYLEGARMYAIAGVYYIWLTRPHSGQYVLKSSSGPFGPYECRRVIGAMLSPIPGSGYPHQGGLVDTTDGQWYYMAFMDGYPAGRVPVLAPVTFDSDGWPVVEADYTNGDGQWLPEYPSALNRDKPQCSNSCFRTHNFHGDQLEHCWEWNHNPDSSKWSMGQGGLQLATSTITDNLFMASNTLTHRVIGPRSMATFCLDISALLIGDRAGVCIFREKSAYIGVHRGAEGDCLVYVDDMVMEPFTTAVGWVNSHPMALDWVVTSKGTVKQRLPISMTSGHIRLRVKVDVRAAFTHGYEEEERLAVFEFSINGENFEQMGSPFVLSNTADGWIAYRFAVFNFATKTLGGQVTIEESKIEPW